MSNGYVGLIKTVDSTSAKIFQLTGDNLIYATPDGVPQTPEILKYKLDKIHLYGNTSWSVIDSNANDLDFFSDLACTIPITKDSEAIQTDVIYVPITELTDNTFTDIIVTVTYHQKGDWESAYNHMTETISVPKLVEGSDALNINLDNQLHAIPCDEDGNPTSYSGAISNGSLYRGILDISDDILTSWAITYNRDEIGVVEDNTAGAGEFTYTGRTATVDILTADTSSITFTATYNGIAISKVFSVSKNKSGNSAYSLFIKPATLSIVCDADGYPIDDTDRIIQIDFIKGTTILPITMTIDGISECNPTFVPFNGSYNSVVLTGNAFTSDSMHFTMHITGDNGDFLNETTFNIEKVVKGRPLIFKGKLANPPIGPVENWYYYNTVDRMSYVYDGASWLTLVEDGPIQYTWIVYGVSIDGGVTITDITDAPTTDTEYMGVAYNKETTSWTTNQADYEWTQITDVLFVRDATIAHSLTVGDGSGAGLLQSATWASGTGPRWKIEGDNAEFYDMILSSSNANLGGWSVNASNIYKNNLFLESTDGAESLYFKTANNNKSVEIGNIAFTSLVGTDVPLTNAGFESDDVDWVFIEGANSITYISTTLFNSGTKSVLIEAVGEYNGNNSFSGSLTKIIPITTLDDKSTINLGFYAAARELSGATGKVPNGSTTIDMQILYSVNGINYIEIKKISGIVIGRDTPFTRYSIISGIPDGVNNITHIKFVVTGNCGYSGTWDGETGTTNFRLGIYFDDFNFTRTYKTTQINDDGILIYSNPDEYIKATKDGIIVNTVTLSTKNLTVQENLEVYGTTALFGDFVASSIPPSNIVSERVSNLPGGSGSALEYSRADHFHQLPESISIGGNLTIGGNITQSGSHYITNAETVEVTDNIILLNQGETGDGITAGYAGMVFDRGTLSNYALIHRESDDTGRYGELVTEEGTAGAGAASTITLGATASSVNDIYNNKIIKITSGTGYGQKRTITDYVGSTKVATVSIAWTTVPDNTSTYEIITTDNTKALALRDNTLNDTGIAIWNGTNYTFDTNPGLTFNGLNLILGVQASGTTHAVRADRSISTTYPLTGGGDLTSNRTLSLGYNTTNLKITSNLLNTIQNIATTSSPTFAGITPTNLTTGYLPYKSATTLVNSPIYTDGTNVGIGTTGPEEELEIQKDGRVDILLHDNTAVDGTTASAINFWGSTASYNSSLPSAQIKFLRTGSGGVADTIFSSRDSAGASFDENMRITSTGKVGIGTTAPGKKLTVSSTGTGSEEILIKAETTGSTGFPAIQIDRNSNVRSATMRFSTAGTDDWVIGSPYDAGVASNQFIISPTHSLSAAKLVIQNGGNVGIGTTSPTNKLEVGGTLGNWGIDSQGAIMTFTRPSASYIKASDASGSLYFQTGGTTDNVLKLLSNGDISFNEGQLFIDESTGNVGIGTTAPGAYKLNVNGTSYFAEGAVVADAYALCSNDYSVSDPYRGYYITQAGSTFGKITANELHVKSFIADIEMALVGGQVIAKSVAKLAADCVVGAISSTGALIVEKIQGFNGWVFAVNDYIRLRISDISGTNGTNSLSVTEAWIKITALTDNTQDEVQTFTFIVMSGTATTYKKGSLAIDYGQSGNGILERVAISPIGAKPYDRIATWSTAPYTDLTTLNQIGDLSGVPTSAYGSLPTGTFGIYSQKGFFEGNVFVDGTLTASNIFYAGRVNKNLLPNSNLYGDLMNAEPKWTITDSSTDVANPMGGTTTTKGISGTTGTSWFWTSTPINYVTGVTYTQSCWVRTASGTSGTVNFGANAGGSVDVTVTDTWQRVSITFTKNATGSYYIGFNNPSNSTTFYFWGWQIEEGEYATSYQPTDGTLVSGYGDELVPISSSTFNTDGTSWWIKNRGTLSWNSSTTDATFITNDASSGQYLSKSNLLEIGKRYIISFKAKSLAFSNSLFLNASWTMSDTSIISNPIITSNYQYYCIEFTATSTLAVIYLTANQVNGTAIDIDDISIKEILPIEKRVWMSNAGIGGTIQNPVVQVYDYGMKIKNANHTASLEANSIMIGNITGTANSAIKISNDFTSNGTGITSGLFGYTSGGTESFALRLNGTASIAGWDFTNTKFSKGNVEIDSSIERIKLGVTTTFGSGTGILIGKDGSDYEWYAGNGTQYFWWDGINAKIKGNVTVTSGELSIGTSPNWFRVDTTGNIWTGNATLAGAQAATFAVTNAGVLNATNAIISGQVTANTGKIGGMTNYWNITAGLLTSVGTASIVMATSGSSIKVGAATTIDLGAGVFVDGSGNFRAGTATTGTDFIKATTTTVTLKSSVFDLVAGSLKIYGSSTSSYIKLGVTTGISDVTNAGTWIDNSGNLMSFGNADNYIQRNGTTLTVKSNSFILKGNTTLYVDTAKIALGTSASGLTVAGTSVGTVIDNAGGFLSYGSATNYIRRSGTSLDIKASTFSLQTSTTGSIGLTATSYSAGNGVWLSSTASSRFRVGNAGASRMQWTDTNLEFYNSSNVKVVSLGGINIISGWSADASKIYNTNTYLSSVNQYWNTQTSTNIDTLGSIAQDIRDNWTPSYTVTTWETYSVIVLTGTYGSAPETVASGALATGVTSGNPKVLEVKIQYGADWALESYYEIKAANNSTVIKSGTFRKNTNNLIDSLDITFDTEEVNVYIHITAGTPIMAEFDDSVINVFGVTMKRWDSFVELSDKGFHAFRSPSQQIKFGTDAIIIRGADVEFEEVTIKGNLNVLGTTYQAANDLLGTTSDSFIIDTDNSNINKSLFFGNSSQYIRWNGGSSLFEFSHNMKINGNDNLHRGNFRGFSERKDIPSTTNTIILTYAPISIEYMTLSVGVVTYRRNIDYTLAGGIVTLVTGVDYFTDTDQVYVEYYY